MNEINTRFILLRKALKLTQKEMGDAIGISNSGISNIEKGLRNVTEKHIRLLSVAFSINETWLRTGEGEMFVRSSPAPFDALVKELGVTSNEKQLLKVFLSFSPDERAQAISFAQQFAARLADNQKTL